MRAVVRAGAGRCGWVRVAQGTAHWRRERTAAAQSADSGMHGHEGSWTSSQCSDRRHPDPLRPCSCWPRRRTASPKVTVCPWHTVWTPSCPRPSGPTIVRRRYWAVTLCGLGRLWVRLRCRSLGPRVVDGVRARPQLLCRRPPLARSRVRRDVTSGSALRLPSSVPRCAASRGRRRGVCQVCSVRCCTPRRGFRSLT